MKIKFVGTASENVTGSSLHITFNNGKKILLDCGMYQSNNRFKDYLINNANFPFKVSELDYVILSHVHADHSALIPKLYSRGYRGKIGIVNGSKEILKNMLDDSFHVMSDVAISIKRKCIFEKQDIDTTIKNIEEYNFYDHVKIDEDIYFEFIPNGHIAKSAQIIIHEKRDKFVYTGDLGNVLHKHPYCEEFAPVRNCNVFVGESTYGERSRVIDELQRDKDISKLKEIIEKTNGTILIPCFSLARTQTMLNILSKMDLGINIYVDSPLSSKITLCYDELYGLKDILCNRNIHLIKTWEESLKIQSNQKKKVVIASAGMLNAGRSVEWLKIISQNASNSLVFVGYNSQGTIASKIQNGVKKLNISKLDYEIKCPFYTLNSFSSHMQREDLLKYYSSLNCNTLILTHGTSLGKQELKEDLERLFQESCKSTRVLISEKNMEVII